MKNPRSLLTLTLAASLASSVGFAQTVTADANGGRGGNGGSGGLAIGGAGGTITDINFISITNTGSGSVNVTINEILNALGGDAVGGAGGQGGAGGRGGSATSIAISGGTLTVSLGSTDIGGMNIGDLTATLANIGDLMVPLASGDSVTMPLANLDPPAAPLAGGDSDRTPTPVPEPASLALLGAGLVGLSVVRRRC